MVTLCTTSKNLSICNKLRQRATLVESGATNVVYTEAMQAYADFLKTGDTTEPLFAELINDDNTKAIMESLILADCPSDLVTAAFDVPKRSYEWYKELFFDTSIFYTKLGKIAYALSCDDDYRELRIRAIDVGYSYIINIYCGVDIPKDVRMHYMNKLLGASYNKALNVNYSGANSVTAQNSKEYIKLAMQLNDTIEGMTDTNSANNQSVLSLLTSDVSEHVIKQEQNVHTDIDAGDIQ